MFHVAKFVAFFVALFLGSAVNRVDPAKQASEAGLPVFTFTIDPSKKVASFFHMPLADQMFQLIRMQFTPACLLYAFFYSRQQESHLI